MATPQGILDAERANHPLQTAESSDPIGMRYNGDIEARAISIVRGEKARWEVATAFVTDRVSFKMRQLIRILRKNYYGIFDVPIDQYTGLEKTWYPLTEINVEAVLANVNIDQKDINFRAKTPDGYGITDITRAAVKDKLHKIYFEQKLNDFLRMLCIDGTAVWKTWEENGELRLALVDLLNIYIDPTSPSIQQAYRFTERSLQLPEQIMGMKGWTNTENIGFNIPEGLPRTDPYWMNRATQVNSNVREIDVYETWGQIPKSLITGDLKDDGEEVEGHIVVSGIDSPGRERVHLIELNKKKDAEGNSLKPYEECWYTRVPNRWYGRGVAEKLVTLQIYANIVFNVRINRARISQLGIFKMKKGAGVTPQMLARLPSNGVVVLNNLDDLQQFEVQEVGESSYKDEDVIQNITQRLTSAFNIATGENLPSDTPATTSAIQNQNAQTAFTLIKNGIAGFLERWMDRHALRIIAKELTAGELVRITSDEDSYGQLIEKVVTWKALEALKDSFSKGYLPTQQEITMEMQHATEKLRKGDMFIELVKDVIADELQTEMYVTNDELNTSVTIQNLMTMLQLAPQYADQIIQMTTDLMGLSPFKAVAQQPQQPQGAPQQGPQAPSPQPQQPPVPSGSGAGLQALQAGSR